MIIDWRTKDINARQVFHFKNSLRPFIEADTTSIELVFIDISSMTAYTYEELLQDEGLEFYSCEDVGSDDFDFKGVEIDGKLDWVD